MAPAVSTDHAVSGVATILAPTAALTYSLVKALPVKTCSVLLARVRQILFRVSSAHQGFEL